MGDEERSPNYSSINFDPRVNGGIDPNTLVFKYTVLDDDGATTEELSLGTIMSRYVAFKEVLEAMCNMYGWTMGDIEEYVRAHK